MKENEMDEPCNMHGSSENAYKILIKKNKLKGKYHLDVLGVQERVTGEWILESEDIGFARCGL
jgi:hypothetical protein